MKKRWMKNIVETSKTIKTDLPFARHVRHAARTAPAKTSLRIA